MIWFASMVFILGAIITAVFRPAWAWVVLAVPLVWILMMWLVLRSQRLGHIPELSAAGNELLRKFGHYYKRPFAGAAYSSACSGLTLGSIVIAAIGAFKGFWWGLAIGLVAYAIAAFLARQFNPTKFFTNDRERAAHNDLVALIQKGSSENPSS